MPLIKQEQIISLAFSLLRFRYIVVNYYNRQTLKNNTINKDHNLCSFNNSNTDLGRVKFPRSSNNLVR
jgi:hypothetical protein